MGASTKVLLAVALILSGACSHHSQMMVLQARHEGMRARHFHMMMNQAVGMVAAGTHLLLAARAEPGPSAAVAGREGRALVDKGLAFAAQVSAALDAHRKSGDKDEHLSHFATRIRDLVEAARRVSHAAEAAHATGGGAEAPAALAAARSAQALIVTALRMAAGGSDLLMLGHMESAGGGPDISGPHGQTVLADARRLLKEATALMPAPGEAEPSAHALRAMADAASTIVDVSSDVVAQHAARK